MIDMPCPKCAAPICEIEVVITSGHGHRMGRAYCGRCGAASRMVRETKPLGEAGMRDRITESWRAYHAQMAMPGLADALELSWRLISHAGANQIAKGLPHPQAPALSQIEAQLAILGRPAVKEDRHAA